MEIGSFIELQFEKGKEYWNGDNVLRLNTGRAAIWHAFKLTECKQLFLPVYQCHSVENFLNSKGVKIKYYNIKEDFSPDLKELPSDSAILLVNYFGIFSNKEMKSRANNFQNVIIDNCPAFFATPIENCINIYSARKFFGVPDGSYIIGAQVSGNVNYNQDYSSDSSNFLLKRIEYGCEGDVYREREKNEVRLDNSDALRMSKLTHTILDGVDYEYAKTKRRENFKYAQKLFDSINLLNVNKFFDEECVPMVYPLMTDDSSLLEKLLKNKHFQGNWWRYILELPNANNFERQLSKYMTPITIEQRYGEKELDYISNIIYG